MLLVGRLQLLQGLCRLPRLRPHQHEAGVLGYNGYQQGLDGAVQRLDMKILQHPQHLPLVAKEIEGLPHRVLHPHLLGGRLVDEEVGGISGEGAGKIATGHHFQAQGGQEVVVRENKGYLDAFLLGSRPIADPGRRQIPPLQQHATRA